MAAWLRRVLTALVVVAGSGMLGAPAASAAEATARPLGSAAGLPSHPLGNATKNQYLGLRIAPDRLDLDYVLDLAELPAYQLCGEQFGTSGCQPAAPGAPALAVRTCADVSGHLHVSVSGRPAALRVERSALTFPPGTAGLLTARFECAFSAPARLGPGASVSVENSAYPGTVGWREITAIGDRMTVRPSLAQSSPVPARSASARLTAYPNELLSSPPDVRTVELTVQPGGPAAGGGSTGTAGPDTGSDRPATRGVDRLSLAYTALVARQDLTVGFALVALLLAAGLGCLHALAPGHGKTVMAAYLVGSRGTARQAASIGLTVAITHTVGVLALGLVLSASAAVAPQQVYPWLGLASGLLLVVVGGGMLRRALRSRGHGHDHPHGHGHSHTHPHGHPDAQSHHHEHAHQNRHPGDTHHHASAPRLRSLIGMGVAGGMVPSPSALLVLLGGIALGRPWFGVVLVVAYGLGMAGVLTGIGLLLARGRALLDSRAARRGDRPSRWRLALRVGSVLPFGTAALVLAVGFGVALSAARSLPV